MQIGRWALRATLALALTSAAVLSALAEADQAIDPAGMDTTIRPGDDFYGYANGKWLADAEIPPDSASWGRLVELRELTRHPSPGGPGPGE